MRYSRLLTLFSLAALLLALFLLPRGTRERLRHFGRLFTQPSEEMAALSLRLAREALGGLPPNMTVADRDALLAEQARLATASQTANSRIQALEVENQTLQKMLQHTRLQRNYALVAAEILKRPAWSASRHTVVIDRGASSGVQPGQAVLSLEGVVGVVIESTARQAIVELHSSPAFTLPCEVAGRRLSAVLEYHGGNLVLNAILGEDYARGAIGDQVLTTDLGNDAMQPGLSIGTIAELSWDENGAPRYTVTPVASTALLKFLFVALPEHR